MLWTFGRGETNAVYGRKLGLLHLRWYEMDHAVQGGAWHDVNKQTSDFIQGMEDERVSPHGNGDSIVSQSEAESADEETLAGREEPDAEDEEEVDKIAEIGEKVMVANLVILVPANGHEVGELQGVPVVEIGGIGADEVAGQENVQDAGDKGHFLHGSDSLCIFPSLVDAFDVATHAALVLVELLVGGGGSAAPFLDDLVLCRDAGIPQLFLLLADLVGLSLKSLLETLEALREGQVLQDVEHGQAVQRGK